jgi:hypothetical protein
MWFVCLILFITSGFAADASDVRTTRYLTHDAPAEPLKPMTGTLSLENAVRNLGYRIEDLEVVQAEYTEGIDAPTAARAERRHQKWGSQFGQSTLKVKRKRMIDQKVLNQSITARSSQHNSKPICTTTPTSDTRKVTLNTFGDIRRKSKQPNAKQSKTVEHRVFYLADQESRTAVAHLEPGESMTVIEVIGKTKKQPKRRIELKQRNHTLSITESNTEQTVCINPTEL